MAAVPLGSMLDSSEDLPYSISKWACPLGQLIENAEQATMFTYGTSQEAQSERQLY